MILRCHLEAEGQAVAYPQYLVNVRGGVCIAGYAVHFLQEELSGQWLRQQIDAVHGAASIFKCLLAAAGHDDDAAGAALLGYQPLGMAVFNIIKNQQHSFIAQRG